MAGRVKKGAAENVLHWMYEYFQIISTSKYLIVFSLVKGNTRAHRLKLIQNIFRIFAPLLLCSWPNGAVKCCVVVRM